MSERELLDEALCEERLVVSEAGQVDLDDLLLIEDSVLRGRKIEALVRNRVAADRSHKSNEDRRLSRRFMLGRVRQALRRLCGEDVRRLVWLRLRLQRLNEAP